MVNERSVSGLCVHTCALCCILDLGGRALAREWIHVQMRSFIVSVVEGKKQKIQYGLPLVGNCCRAAWILSASFPNPRNSRVTAIEAIVRDPSKQKNISLSCHKVSFQTRTNYCRTYLMEYIWLHSQQSPSTSDL